MKLEKVYAVTFMQYTNFMNDTVSDNNKDWSKLNYLNVGQNFLIKESDIEKYRVYGGGYRSLTFVGEIEV